MSHALEVLGVIAAALLAAAAIVAPSVRARAALALSALALAPVLLAADIWHSPQLSTVRDRPALAAAGILAALVAGAAPRALIAPPPFVAPGLAGAAPPLPLPLSPGGSTAGPLL